MLSVASSVLTRSWRAHAARFAARAAAAASRACSRAVSFASRSCSRSAPVGTPASTFDDHREMFSQQSVSSSPVNSKFPAGRHEVQLLRVSRPRGYAVREVLVQLKYCKSRAATAPLERLQVRSIGVYASPRHAAPHRALPASKLEDVDLALMA